MYRLFILLGAQRIKEVMEAKGYILGTSQVSPHFSYSPASAMQGHAMHIMNNLTGFLPQLLGTSSVMHVQLRLL